MRYPHLKKTARRIGKTGPAVPVLLTLALLAAPLPVTASSATDRHLFDSELTFEYPDATYITGAVSGDLNGDGHNDYIFAVSLYSTSWSSRIESRLGRGDGTFGDPIWQGEYTRPQVLGDFNEDGVLDLLSYWIEGNPGKKAIHLGNGDGTFEETDRHYACDEYFNMSRLGDMDNDGHLDIVGMYHHDSTGYISINYGHGDGTFLGRTLYFAVEDDYYGYHSGTSHSVTSLALGDFDGDGNQDVAFLDSYFIDYGYYFAIEAANTEILLGNGDRTFSDPVDLSVNGQDFVEPHHIFSADLNGDQRPELIRSYEYGMKLLIQVNNGDGTFTAGQDIEAAADVTTVSCRDVNGDGWSDLVAVGTGVSVHLGNGSGGFIDHRRYPSCQGGYSGGLTDLDENGSADILTMAWEGYGSILFAREDGRLGAARTVESGTDQPQDLACGDFNEDGHPDLAVTTHSWWYSGYYESWQHDPGLVVLTGDGSGGFTRTLTLEVEPVLSDLISVDLNHDGHLDLVANSLYYDPGYSVLLGRGDGTFEDPVPYSGDGREMVTADFNGDGHPDLAMTSGASLLVMPGNGDGTFGTAESIPVGRNPEHLCTADFNNDGAPDLATSDRAIAINNGDGTFADPLHIGSGWSYDYSITAAHLNGDEFLDLAVLKRNTDSSYQAEVHFLTGTGDGTFVIGPIHTVDYSGGFTESYPTSKPRLLIEDLNGDGIPDLVITHHGLQVHLGTGEFSFDEPLRLGTARMLRALAHDLDNDGDLDLAAPLFDMRDVAVFLNGSGQEFLATGPGPGPDNPPLVRLFRPAHANPLPDQWLAYGAPGYGVNVALGNLRGNGVTDVVTGPGPGQIFGPHVRAFQTDGTPISEVSFQAYGTLKYGVNVSCGDIDGDGLDEIITGAGPGAVFGPHVRGWNWDGEGPVEALPDVSFFAYGTPKWGVNVCCGDIDGDGMDEIVTGAGPGTIYGPHVRAWNYDGGGPVTPISGVSYFAYGTLQWGVNVSCGDIDNDGIDEIVTGPGPGAIFGPHVRAWNWDGEGTAQPIPGVNFFAYDLDWGVNVSCGDIDNDGIDEIVTGPGPGPGNPASVRGWNYDGQELAAIPGVSFTAYDFATSSNGVKVAAPKAD